MSRIIRLIDNETIEISDYRNSGYLFDHNAPTIQDIRKQISNIDDWCVFKETINPFVLYGEKEKLQQRIDKAIEHLHKINEQNSGALTNREETIISKHELLKLEITNNKILEDILRGKDENKS